METNKILIHQDDVACSRITEEIKIRQRLLNAMIDAKLSVKEIEGINSQKEVDRIIFERHLQVNKALAHEYAAGKRAAHLAEVYVLPLEIELVKDAIEAWLNYPAGRGSDKFKHLKIIDGRYELNQETIEQELTTSRYKLYGNERVIDKVKKLDPVIELLIEENEPPHRALNNPFFDARLTCDSNLSCNQLQQRKFMVKRAYLLGLMEQRN